MGDGGKGTNWQVRAGDHYAGVRFHQAGAQLQDCPASHAVQWIRETMWRFVEKTEGIIGGPIRHLPKLDMTSCAN